MITSIASLKPELGPLTHRDQPRVNFTWHPLSPEAVLL